MPAAEETAVADVYAGALLELAEQSGVADEVGEQLADLVAYMDQDEEFATFMTSAAVGTDLRREKLERIFRGKLNELLLNTVLLMNDKGRAELIRELNTCYRLALEELRGQLEVGVASAVELTAEVREQIRTEVERWTGKSAILIEKVDPELIGGMVLRIGDMRVDGSVSRRLRGLRDALLERASAELHSGADYWSEVAG